MSVRAPVAEAEPGHDPATLYSRAFYWLLADPDLAPAEKLVWLVLNRWDHPDERGRPRSWYPSNADIAEAAGLSVPQVRRALDGLIAKGWLQRLDAAGEPMANPTHRVLIRKRPAHVPGPGPCASASRPRARGRSVPLRAGEQEPYTPARTTLRSLSLDRIDPSVRSPGGDLDLPNDNDPDASGLRVVAPPAEAPAPSEPEPNPVANPDPVWQDPYVPETPLAWSELAEANDPPVAIPTPRALADGVIAQPEPAEERIRRQEIARAEQLAALKARIESRAVISIPPRDPSPPTSPTPPEPPPDQAAKARPCVPIEELTAGQRDFIDHLDPGQIRRFHALGLDGQGAILSLHEACFDRIIAAEQIRRLSPRRIEALAPMPATVEEMILTLPGGPPERRQQLAEMLAQGFGTERDRKLWPAFQNLAYAVWSGSFPAEVVADAYRQAMGPKAKKRGAVFAHVLHGHGWVG